LDSDQEIERRRAARVSDFREDGETKFAKWSGRSLSEVTRRPAAWWPGGGLVVPTGMLELLRSRGIVICMHAPIETILRRTLHATHRPLCRWKIPNSACGNFCAARGNLPAGRHDGADRQRPLREIAAHVCGFTSTRSRLPADDRAAGWQLDDARREELRRRLQRSF